MWYVRFCAFEIGHQKLECKRLFSVAEGVLAKQSLELAGTSLHVRKYQQLEPKLTDLKPEATASSSDKVTDTEDTHSNVTRIPNDAEDPEDLIVLEVRGIPPGISRQMLELFFENTKQSGGGEIERLDYDTDGGQTLITYKTNEGMFAFLALWYLLPIT